ncbi:malonyl-ACP O-methyltransferase BioC [Acinetobacter shaoyimingii]|uniref:Malonyl-[acyl-carrier protein] O-methyltransferase n=1 Tax=Acinetobacter shaoyimingii TaxID=2715164 RepID=A0A6G8S003_9GAMM|nr:malonyl-ACP O-methyltransferase BioC [Acinetobacter shaoyimingii]QIO07532.1 malonyl-ACP O-methyltransferase BioC [Acinetobacter shaoyimingii]
MDDIELIKPLIAQRFEKAHLNYNEHALIQKKVANELMQLIQQYLDREQVNRAFEIGCGSGNLSHLFIQKYPIQTLVLNDLYDNVKQHFSGVDGLEWQIGDVDYIEFPSSLDLVMSNAALQWVNDLDGVVSKAKYALNHQGLFCFSTFGKRNLKEIKTLTGRGLVYLQLEEIRAKLLKQGFEILHLSECTEQLHFIHPKQVLTHLQATGVTATSQDKFRWTKDTLEDFYTGYRRFITTDEHENIVYPLSYHPIYVVARRGA